MATLTIRKPDGSSAGSLEVSDAVFGIEPNAHCIRAILAQYMANQRAGTHSTKTRGMVSGGGRKPWRQKGTGRARQGSTRATQWRHGAICFGPSPRDYSYPVNRKVRQQAFRSVWTEFAAADRLIVLDGFGLTAPRTRDMVALLRNLGIDGPALVLTARTEEAVALSARNIAGVTPLNCENLNIYDLLTHDYIVATTEAVKRVEETYA